MKFPLNGKYSTGEIVIIDGKRYFKKTVKLPRHIDPGITTQSIYAYRKQLAENGIKTTALHSHKINKIDNSVILTERFYDKSLEIIIGNATKEIVRHLFRRLLNLVSKIYSTSQNPKIIVEVKPSNFLLERNRLLYCDFVPPRLYKPGKGYPQLEFYQNPSASKRKSLEFRFLTEEGAYYYLLLHTISIRPSFSKLFVNEMLSTINKPGLRRALHKRLSSREFKADQKKFVTFYTARAKAYRAFDSRRRSINHGI